MLEKMDTLFIFYTKSSHSALILITSMLFIQLFQVTSIGVHCVEAGSYWHHKSSMWLAKSHNVICTVYSNDIRHVLVISPLCPDDIYRIFWTLLDSLFRMIIANVYSGQNSSLMKAMNRRQHKSKK